MEPENIKIKNLLKTVTDLTSCLQASSEVDFYFFSRVHKILETFTAKDWESLKTELPKWNEKQLNVLVQTLDEGDGLNNRINDNFFIGYIFTLSPDNLAITIFYNILDYFFDENEITSIELINSIENRINKLYENKYINEEATYTFWINKIAEARKKAIC